MTTTPLPRSVVLEGSCAAWLHAAAPADERPRLGVVLCGTMGFEGMRAYRGWRMLAASLAGRGLPTLRFDYEGTGDSGGDGVAHGQIDRWVHSVHAAVAALRAYTGVAEVALVGLRLGGLLAAEAAASLGGVARLALLAPVISGRTHARELRLVADSWRSVVMPVPFSVPDPSPDLNVAGDRWSPDMLAVLATHDLRRLARCPAPEVLLLESADRPVASQLAPRFADLGAALTIRPFPGLDDYLLRDEALSQPPRTAYAALVDWLTRPLEATSSFPQAIPPQLPADPVISLPYARERPVRFGPADAIFGVFSEPGAVQQGTPALLLLNTGANHRAGGGRLGATLCRRLAAQGVASLRLDLRGLGDSDDRADAVALPLYDLSARTDVTAALDWLEAHGHRRVVVAGICSGAFLAFHSALAERRIVGAAVINLQQFVWQEGTSFALSEFRTQQPLHVYRHKMLQPRQILRLLRGKIPIGRIAWEMARRGWQRLRREADGVTERLLGVETCSGQVTRWLRALSARGTSVRLWYGPNDPGLGPLALHCGALGANLRGLQHIEVSILEGADHTLSFQPGRDLFVERLLNFVQELSEPSLRALPASQSGELEVRTPMPTDDVLVT